jgi:hypothetical protein
VNHPLYMAGIVRAATTPRDAPTTGASAVRGIPDRVAVSKRRLSDVVYRRLVADAEHKLCWCKRRVREGTWERRFPCVTDLIPTSVLRISHSPNPHP